MSIKSGTAGGGADSAKNLADAPRFADKEEALAWLDHLGMFNSDMRLGRMESALSMLGLADGFCPTVQIVGTNGKGSTSTFLYSLALEHGLRAGVYNSPHFVDPGERIRINGSFMDPALWPELMQKALGTAPDLTYFELVTVVALQAYKLAGAEALFLEAGMGARYDATTAFPAQIACICPIAADHTDVLGATVEAIAGDKAYAIRRGMYAAVTAPQVPEVMAVLRRRAAEEGVPLYTFGDADTLGATLPDGVQLGLRGAHQHANAQLALIAWHLFCAAAGIKSDPRPVREGLEKAFLPGRMQLVPAHDGLPPMTLDGAHNAHGMASLVNSLKAEGSAPHAIVFSCLADKHPEELVAILDRGFPGIPVIIPKIADNPRAAAPEALAALFGKGRTVYAAAGLADALDEVRNMRADSVLLCGSLYLLGEFFAMYPRYLEAGGQH
ncbi:MAG: bifunctional folylpolyglutamate synthase/dihydrofolate synthase [Mailhella sp.]|nr:bifunctional folylpolyglutamate synthase/dihydrofolate synthase [Mailhella sp.]